MKIREDFLPFALPFFNEEEISGVAGAIRSNWWSRGPLTGEFEKRFADYIGVKNAIAVNSCTAALHLALLCSDIGPGDEVLVPAMTFCSTANTVVHTGATPVFLDIDEETGLLDPALIEEKITPRTKAIMAVHYAGQACDMDAIGEVAQRYRLRVIEDAAHAVYTTYKGKMAGALGNPAAFSFYATKNLATGEGGMLTTDDDDFAARARVLSLHGMSRNAWNRYGKGGSWRYEVLEAGYKYNMTDLAAALGLAQMDKLESMQRRRAEIAAAYDAAFAGIEGIAPLRDRGLGRHSHHLYVLKADPARFRIGRDEWIDLLMEEYNIGMSVHFIPLPLQPLYQNKYDAKLGDFPHTERYFTQIMTLPLYPSMTKDDVDYVAEAVREIATRYAV